MLMVQNHKDHHDHVDSLTMLLLRTVSGDEDLFVQKRFIHVDDEHFDVVFVRFAVITVLHDPLLHFLPIQRSVDVRRMIGRHFNVRQPEDRERVNALFTIKMVGGGGV